MPPISRATIELRLDEATYVVDVDHGTIEIRRESARRPDAVITTDAATLRSVVFGDRKLKAAPVALDGDRTLARVFLRLFKRP